MSLVSYLITKFSGGGEGKKEKQSSRPSFLDFISPACHYDSSTVLNKSGELVQIIKVEDYVSDVGADNLRAAVRRSIARVQDPGVSFWVYTVREKKKLELFWKEKGDFSDALHKAYRSGLDAKYVTYANEVYIAVVTYHLREGLSKLATSLWFSQVKKRYKEFLSVQSDKLCKITSAMLEELKEFRARRLDLIPDEDKQRSELLEFLSYLVTLRHKKYYLEERDSAYMCDGYDMRVGFNTFRIADTQGVKYGAILGIKEYLGESLEAVDNCLQQDCEFIVVEILRFIKSRGALKEYKRQADLLEVSGDRKLMELSGLDTIMSVQEDSMLDFCERKVCFVINADSMKMLRHNIAQVVNALSQVGAIAVKLDLDMEGCFWGNLPGNFPHVIGMRTSLVKDACTFAVTHYFPSGVLKGGKWSEAITLFFSNRGRPYFFGFHVKDKGHTVCVGPHGSSTTLLLNFILSESRRLGVRIIQFDYSGKSIIFTKAVNGEYHRVDDRKEHVSASFNPFNVEDTKIHRNVAEGVLKRMVSPLADVSEEVALRVKKAIDDIFALPIEERVKDKIDECIGGLGGQIRHWIGQGKFAHLIQDKMDINWGAEVLAINAGVLIKQQECFSVILYYFLHILEKFLDGSPTILVLHEAWVQDLVFYSENEFDVWMNKLSTLNVVVVFAAENVQATASSKVLKYLNKHVETRIFMPHFMLGSQQHVRLFGLLKEEMDIMLQIPRHEGHFFLKQGGSSVVLVLTLPPREARVLSANRVTIKMMYEAIAAKGSEWMADFHSRCDSLEKF